MIGILIVAGVVWLGTILGSAQEANRNNPQLADFLDGLDSNLSE